MPDVTLTIDGETVTVPAGTNLVDAARAAGVAIPVFCYHPKMKPVGMCRMCLVEVWTPKIDPATRQPVLDNDGKPVLALMMNKLQPGCVTPVSPGMDVRTTTDKTAFAQRGVLELLLTSHPLDCPVCDKGGECPLQNLTMGWGPGASRFDYEDKVHFEKPIPLGNLIYLDRERCILCSRCVRFQDELADDPVLGFDNRGRTWEIISKSDPPFDSKFSGNTTDICPVGALTSSDFRFKARVWELKSTPHVCTHCSVGCNTTLDTKLGELMRVMPRENDFVNEIWICDKGRYGMRYYEHPDRLTTPMIRRNNQLEPATWDEAFQLISEKLAAVREQAGSAAIGGLIGPQLPNEDLFLFHRLFREVLGSNNLDHRLGLPDDPILDTQIPQYGVGKGTNLTELGKGTAVLVLGADVEEEAPIYKLRLRGIALRGGELIVANSFGTRLDRSATRTVRFKPGTEAHLALALVLALIDEKLTNTQFIGDRVRGTEELLASLKRVSLAELASTIGVAEEQIRAMAKSFAAAENGIILYGRAALTGTTATAQALATLAVLAGKVGRANSGLIALTPGGNSRGALDLGVRPDLPGAVGKSAAEMWQAAATGELRAMYVVGMNPAGVSPQLEEALNALEFVVVQDLFLTETAQLADVVLPAAAYPEREGSVTNAERRVQRSRQARPAPAQLPPDWVIFQDLARLLQPAQVATPVVATNTKKAAKAATPSTVSVAAPVAAWSYAVSSDIADEISRSVPSYAKTNYTSLELSRQSWGRQPADTVYYDGTSYANSEGVGVQLPSRADDARALLNVGAIQISKPTSSAEFTHTLLMPTRAYDGGDWMRGSKLEANVPHRHAVLSLADAKQLGVGIGERVSIQSGIGELMLPVVIDASLSAGVVLVPQVRGIDPLAILTGAYTRVRVTKIED
jgi:NADH-quinone oxidoreductase subunit G